MSCLANPDVWLRIARWQDRNEFYEYLLVYTDNLLAIAANPKAILDDINLCNPNNMVGRYSCIVPPDKL